MVGHEHRNEVVEYGIPDIVSSSTNLNTLATATLLQGYQNVMQRTVGRSSEIIEKVGGLKLISDAAGHKKLIGAGYEYYDTSGQRSMHFVVNNSADLSASGVEGDFSIEGPARKQSGYMAILPPEWQQVFG